MSYSDCATLLPPGAKSCHNCKYALAKPLDASAQARLWRHVPEEFLGKLETACGRRERAAL